MKVTKNRYVIIRKDNGRLFASFTRERAATTELKWLGNIGYMLLRISKNV